MFKEYPRPARLTQLLLATGFLSFGAAWLASPDHLATLFSREQPAAVYPIVTLALSFLGIQALAFGIFALVLRFSSATFAAFGIAMLPLFLADYWLYQVTGAFNEMALVHIGGLSAMLAMCTHGFRVMREREQAIEELGLNPF